MVTCEIHLMKPGATPYNVPYLPSEGKGHTFESCRVRQFFTYFVVAVRRMSALSVLAAFLPVPMRNG